MLSPKMIDRFKTEADRNGQYDYQVAEYLNIAPQTYSRFVRGEYPIRNEYVEKLADLWGVRKDYLLCVDDIRTNEEYYDNHYERLSKRQRVIWEALPVYGYEFEYVDLNPDVNQRESKTKYFSDYAIKISKDGKCYGYIDASTFVQFNELLEISVQNLFETVLYINRYNMERAGKHDQISLTDRKKPFSSSIWKPGEHRDFLS